MNNEEKNTLKDTNNTIVSICIVLVIISVFITGFNLGIIVSISNVEAKSIKETSVNKEKDTIIKVDSKDKDKDKNKDNDKEKEVVEENTTSKKENWLEYNSKYLEYLPEESLRPIVPTESWHYYDGPNGTEDYYNVPMEETIRVARAKGYSEENYPYWIREDGCKMFGKFIICATDYDVHSYGSIINTSLGKAIVIDTNYTVDKDDSWHYCSDIDIATEWE